MRTIEIIMNYIKLNKLKIQLLEKNWNIKQVKGYVIFRNLKQ